MVLCQLEVMCLTTCQPPETTSHYATPTRSQHRQGQDDNTMEKFADL